MTYEQLHELAREVVLEEQGEYWTEDVTIVRDPPGAWGQPRHTHGHQYHGGPWPFVIDRADRLVTRLRFWDQSRAIRTLMQWRKEGKPESNRYSWGRLVALPRLKRGFAFGWLARASALHGFRYRRPQTSRKSLRGRGGSLGDERAPLARTARVGSRERTANTRSR